MGNLRQQLIKDKICARLEDTKPWIRQHCRVQFLVIENGKERTIVEHLVLAVLEPRYADEVPILTIIHPPGLTRLTVCKRF